MEWRPLKRTKLTTRDEQPARLTQRMADVLQSHLISYSPFDVTKAVVPVVSGVELHQQTVEPYTLLTAITASNMRLGVEQTVGQITGLLEGELLGLRGESSSNGRTTAEVHCELANRCLLSSLYDAQLALMDLGTTTAARGYPAGSSAKPCPAANVVPMAILNAQHAISLASYLQEYDSLVYCAVSLAGLHVGRRRDLAAAAAVLDECAAQLMCCGASAAGIGEDDTARRAALLLRVLPKSMEVYNMQGRTSDSFARWQQLNRALLLCGRSTPQRCPICAGPFSPDRGCFAMSCGHSFHRDCCDAWLGRMMHTSGVFRAECPVCKQHDPALHPTPAAVQALNGHRRAAGEHGASTSSGSDSGSSTSSGSHSSSSSSGSCNTNSSSSSCQTDNTEDYREDEDDSGGSESEETRESGDMSEGDDVANERTESSICGGYIADASEGSDADNAC
ncbi:hypothetical protein Agub_g13539 [Astrephomene gubernaculifera]|uniref:RING-type domain-containing protein n=1 Tax=Astrephomene gubernaculifera TaxID=47775 RepID=A0AAD3E2B2_9CHLO|nr:hypothetical protein Agub_g13539 [Astrephomene gubernaculifera]